MIDYYYDELSAILDYLLFAVVVIFLIAAYSITDMLFRPIWYVYNKNKKKLCENPPFLEDSWRIDAANNGLGNPKKELGLEYINVEFNCGPTMLSGNRKLRGWLIPNRNRDKKLCVVVCHGGGRDRRQHLRHVPHLHEHDAAVLLFDKQEHGLSDGNQRGVGWFTYEASDVYAACKFMKQEQNFERVVAMGTSFGGAGVLTAAGYYDGTGKKQIIDAVIAENPPHSRLRFVRELIHQRASPFGVPNIVIEILSYLTSMVISLRRGVFLSPYPIDVVQKISPRPLLITHGEADSIVPLEHGLDLYEAALEPKSCLWVPKCEHCMIFNVDPKGWKIKTSELLKKALSYKK